MQTIVIGHKNPDMDSICSAIAYAELKRKLGVPDVIAARAGNTSRRLFLCHRLPVGQPTTLERVRGAVRRVMGRSGLTGPHRLRHSSYGADVVKPAMRFFCWKGIGVKVKEERGACDA